MEADDSVHGTSLSLLTDLYQLTMSQGYLAAGRGEDRAVFHLFFRKLPFGGGFAIAAGMEPALEWLKAARFDESDVAYLASLRAADGSALFAPVFLERLRGFRFGIDVDMVAEGTAVFPHEPLVRVEGPLWHCQLAETALLTIINFQTLIATKAARMVHAAAGDPVIEFGLRRAQGIDGGLSATRAAFVGGVAATSNVLAGKLLGVPVRGTHAHSWVMAFEDELESFRAYAKAMPNNCLLLVDTFDTLRGVRNAVIVGGELEAAGHRLLGIRLDSGDLAYLSIEARKILDAAGLNDASIVASNDLDERTILSLKHQGAKIDTWGVGTRLVTGGDQSALGGVYKLAAIRTNEREAWRSTIKLSDHVAKVSIPGRLDIGRCWRDGRMVGDAIVRADEALAGGSTIVDADDPTREKRLEGDRFEMLLEPRLRGGEVVGQGPARLIEARQRAIAQRAALHPGVLRFDSPHQYPAGIEQSLAAERLEMVRAARQRAALGAQA